MLSFSDFTLRYLTRRGLTPLVFKRIIESTGTGTPTEIIKRGGFNLATMFYWTSTPEGHMFWQNLHREIREKFWELSQEKEKH